MALLRAKLSIDLRLRDLAVLTSASMVVRHGSTILFALLGFKANELRVAVRRRCRVSSHPRAILVGWMPRQGGRTRDVLRELFPAVKWLLLAAVAIAAVTRGDYIVVGKLESKAVTGQYFFAFQLVVALTIPFTAEPRRGDGADARAIARSARPIHASVSAAPCTASFSRRRRSPSTPCSSSGRRSTSFGGANGTSSSSRARSSRCPSRSVLLARWRFPSSSRTGGGGLLGLIYTGEAVSICSPPASALVGRPRRHRMTIASARILTAIVVVLLGSRLAGLSLGRTVRAMTGAAPSRPASAPRLPGLQRLDPDRESIRADRRERRFVHPALYGGRVAHLPRADPKSARRRPLQTRVVTGAGLEHGGPRRSTEGHGEGEGFVCAGAGDPCIESVGRVINTNSCSSSVALRVPSQRPYHEPNHNERAEHACPMPASVTRGRITTSEPNTRVHASPHHTRRSTSAAQACDVLCVRVDERLG